MLIITQSVHVITDFGAVPHVDTRGAHIANAKAFVSAVIKANATENGERIVKVPKGTFYSFPMRMDYVKNVTIII